MNSEVRARIEKLAEERYNHELDPRREAFIAGAKALDKLYSEGVGEFDEAAVSKAWLWSEADEGSEAGFKKGARHMFEQMKGRVEVFRLRALTLDLKVKDLEAKLSMKDAEIERLKK